MTNTFAKELQETVTKMSAKGKGLLAADESTGTIAKRFESIKVENTEENRRAYRELLFSIAKESSQYISGVILYEETLFQKTKDGVDFAKLLADNGIVPGIKVDAGLVNLEGTKDQITEGLDGLAKRCQKYYKQGARFAKWRAAISISNDQPSDLCIQWSAMLLARYAAICQANGLVPIVEPEVLVMEGDHDIETSLRVTERVLAAVYKALADNKVVLEYTILKPNMILPGDKSPSKKSTTSQTVAEYTLKALKRYVPPAVPAIMFLSGGQSEDEAAENLNAINKLAGPTAPWALSFSYGRALQQSALKAWKGQEANVKAGQEAYMNRAKNCFLAAQGSL